VIKIERPGGEDMPLPALRGEAQRRSDPGCCSTAARRSAKSTWDLAARGELDALIAGADVLVE
jgi:crotonobetainyl-CoA:carnitine CoA-transferase CaiB-like acyl-CoA transferase